MAQMKSLTLKGKYYEIVDERARDTIYRDCASVIEQTVEGVGISVGDSSNKPIRGLRIFGKSTQNTTKGVQLLPLVEDNTVTDRGITQTISGGICKVTGTSTAESGFNLTLMGSYANSVTYFTLEPGTYTATDCILFNFDGTTRTSYQDTFTITDTLNVTWVSTRTYLVGETVSETTYPMVNAGSVALDWEPYTGGRPVPNPDYPQAIVCPGLDKAINVYIHGGNLLPDVYADGDSKTMNGITFTKRDDGSVLVNGTATALAYYNFNTTTAKFPVPDGWLSTSSGIGYGTGIPQIQNDVYVDGVYQFTVQTKSEDDSKKQVKNATVGASRIKVDAGMTVRNVVIYPMLCSSEDALEYEKPAEIQTLQSTVAVRGVPVDYGGNYTDSNGQQWVCDEVDFEHGIHIKRIGETVFDENQVYHINDYRLTSEGKYVFGCSHTGLAVSDMPVISDRFAHIRWDKWNLAGTTQSIVCYTGVAFFFFLVDQTVKTVEAFTEYMGDHPATIQYVLNTPVTSPLTEAELEVYRQMYTNYPNTAVTNNSGVWMECTYAADLKEYIKSLIGSGGGSGGSSVDLTAAEGVKF